MAANRPFNIGDPVVFRMTKRSPAPGPRARAIEPEPGGEDYQYQVDKYWVVAQIQSDGKLVLRTRRGKSHILPADHPALRKPNLLEKLLNSSRFPKLDQLPEEPSGKSQGGSGK